MANDLLAADAVTVRIGGSRILNGVSLSIAAGESVALIGESGSGKSMFARAVLGLLPRAAQATGSIRFEGRQLVGLSDREYRELRGSRIGYVPQDPTAAFNPTLRVARQIREPIEFHRARAAEVAPPGPVAMLRSVGLSDPERQARQYPHEMSGGMLQRALTAAAVSLRPSLLVADEPTTGLDVTTQAGIMDLIRGLQARNGMALLLISHDLALVSQMCRRIFVLYRGEVVESGITRQVVGAPRHPYAKALLGATPALDKPLARGIG
jgi:ABC-type glutathione transport system ATPase component